MQQSRLFPFATIVAAATAIALTSLPWLSLRQIGFDLSWNGLGLGTSAELDGLAPAARGWWIVGAAVIAILAALFSLAPSEKLRSLSRPANGAAAVVAVLGAFVPIAVLIWPDWYYGDFLTDIGLRDPHDRGMIHPSAGTLVPTALVMLLVAALCAYSARLTPESDAAEDSDVRTE